MGDLISRSALIEELNGIYLDNPYDDKEDILEKAIGIVDHMETAYDVEAVVAELEEMRFEDDCGDAVLLHDAEPIIRNGGKE